jgi:hypothetical protein
VRASQAQPSPKGPSAHAVYDFGSLVAVDGKKLVKSKPASGAAYQGRGVRIDFARHGEPNGVVLDNAQRPADDSRWAAEAKRVTGRAL